MQRTQIYSSGDLYACQVSSLCTEMTPEHTNTIFTITHQSLPSTTPPTPCARLPSTGHLFLFRRLFQGKVQGSTSRLACAFRARSAHPGGRSHGQRQRGMGGAGRRSLFAFGPA